MSSFEWVCPYCGIHRDTKERMPPACANCGLMMNRVWNAFTVARHSVMQAHYNHSAGTYVNNKGELKSAFSRQSDEMSERMNFAVDYQPIDPYDLKHSPEAFGVTEEGLDTQAKTWKDRGGPPQ